MSVAGLALDEQLEGGADVPAQVVLAPGYVTQFSLEAAS
jgi:hypothetical protein